MTKGVKICLAVVITVFITAVAAAFILYRPSESMIAEVVQDNAVIYRFDLAHEKDCIIRIDSADGGWNDIRIQNGTICVCDADCPDKVCVHTGVLKSENLPIVCLPHKLVIRFADEENQ